jgi:penicillin G amidase
MDDWADALRDAARAALPPIEGDVRVAGLAGPVEILRDDWGVAYISAETLDDLWFAQGYVTAAERCFQLELALRASTGRLSELFGDLTLSMDQFVRTVGLHRAGVRIARGYDDESRSMMRSFRRGAAAWIANAPAPPPEYMVLGTSPTLPDDEAAWAAATAYLAWGLSGNWDAELLRALLTERLGVEVAAELLPPSAAARGVVTGAAAAEPSGDRIDGVAPAPPGQGSNNWVVAGERTHSGSPLLANDPHLLVQQPGAWLELHLRAPGYAARGVALAFLPGILIGTTADHAWGITNVSGDTQDLYIERLNRDGTAAEFRGAGEPLTVHSEEIAVRGRPASETLVVRETRHGPILHAYAVGILDPTFVEDGLGETYALRWVGADRSIMPSAVTAVARAASFEEFRRAVRAVECPGQNFVYADAIGTIGYQCTGAYPVRRGWDGASPVAGWAGEFEWDGFIPFESLPWSKDPDRGYIVSANDRVHDDAYPFVIGTDFHPPHRARRIVELLDADERHSVASFARMQHDTVSIAARELLPTLLAIAPATDGARAALELLRGWDGDLRGDAPAAAIYEAWVSALARGIVEPRAGRELFEMYRGHRAAFQGEALPRLLAEPSSAWWGDVGRDAMLARALADAVADLGERLGVDPAAWRWGALHTARFAGPLARMPGLADLFTAAVVELGGDEHTIARAGVDERGGYGAAVVATWRQVIDLSDVDRSIGVAATGQSGNPASPHWADQASLWARGAHHPLPFSRPAVEAAAVASMRMTP